MNTYRQYGESVYSILLHENDRPFFLNECNVWKEYLTCLAEYKVETEENDYYFCLVRIEDYHREGKELTQFMIRHIPFIAMRQEESTFVLVNNGIAFKQALLDIYQTKTQRIYFFYDMLTANERYMLATEGIKEDVLFNDLQFIHEDAKTGCIYQLNFEAESPYLYREESILDIIDNITGEQIEIDIIDYLTSLIFHIAILGKKLEKKW